MVADDSKTRTSLEIGLGDEGYLVRTDADACQLWDVVAGFRPDLVILDMRLRAAPDGYEIARMLRATGDPGVFFLAAAGSVEDRLAGFAAGGDDYLVKPFFMAELQLRVRALLRRTRHLQGQLLQVGDVTLDRTARSVTRSGRPVELTRMEFDLLAVLLSRPNHVSSNQQLMDGMRPRQMFGHNPIPIPTHIGRLRRKLEVHGPRIVHTVRSIGYALRP